jgi:hypothetical protein
VDREGRRKAAKKKDEINSWTTVKISMKPGQDVRRQDCTSCYRNSPSTTNAAGVFTYYLVRRELPTITTQKEKLGLPASVRIRKARN